MERWACPENKQTLAKSITMSFIDIGECLFVQTHTQIDRSAVSMAVENKHNSRWLWKTNTTVLLRMHQVRSSARRSTGPRMCTGRCGGLALDKRWSLALLAVRHCCPSPGPARWFCCHHTMTLRGPKPPWGGLLRILWSMFGNFFQKGTQTPNKNRY